MFPLESPFPFFFSSFHVHLCYELNEFLIFKFLCFVFSLVLFDGLIITLLFCFVNTFLYFYLNIFVYFVVYVFVFYYLFIFYIIFCIFLLSCEWFFAVYKDNISGNRLPFNIFHKNPQAEEVSGNRPFFLPGDFRGLLYKFQFDLCKCINDIIAKLCIGNDLTTVIQNFRIEFNHIV